MGANPDFRDLFSTFNEEGVEYLLVGAHAVIFYAEPRFTKDLDIWVNPTHANAGKTYTALAAFGAPLEGISADDFTNPDLVYQIGIAPNRIDILMSVGGTDFTTAFSNAVSSTYDGIPIKIIGKKDLMASKRNVGRLQDLIDVEKLEESNGD